LALARSELDSRGKVEGRDFCAGALQQVDQHGKHALRRRFAEGVAQDRAVDFHELRPEDRQAVEVGASLAEVVHGDGEPVAAMRGHRGQELVIGGAFGFEELEDNPFGLEAVEAHQLREITPAIQVGGKRRGMHVQEEAPIAGIEHRVVAKVQGAAGPVEMDPVLAVERGKDIADRRRRPVGGLDAYQRLVAHGLAQAHAEERLEGAGEGESVPREAAAALGANHFPCDVSEGSGVHRAHAALCLNDAARRLPFPIRDVASVRAVIA